MFSHIIYSWNQLAKERERRLLLRNNQRQFMEVEVNPCGAKHKEEDSPQYLLWTRQEDWGLKAHFGRT